MKLLVMMMISFHPLQRPNQRFIVPFLFVMMIMIMTMTTITTTCIQNNSQYYSSTHMITLIDAFQIPTIVTIVGPAKQLQHHHQNDQQLPYSLHSSSTFIPRRSRSSITIRSAVSYGRTDDSEWYTDVSTTTTTTTKITDSESSSISNSPIPPTTVSSSSSLSVLSYQTSITSSEQFDNIFHKNNNATNQLMIIKFYASWCKSCKKVQSKINQFIMEEFIIPNNNNMNNNYNNNQQMIHFYNVEYNTNHELCIQHNITQLPTIHIYRSSSCISSNESNPNYDSQTTTSNNSTIGNYIKVQDFPCPPRDFYRLRDYIKFYLHNHQQQQQQQQQDVQDDENEEFGKVNLVPMDTPAITYVKNTSHDNTNGTTNYNDNSAHNTTVVSSDAVHVTTTTSSSNSKLDMGYGLIQTSILPKVIMENSSSSDSNIKESSTSSSLLSSITAEQREPSSSTTRTKHEQILGWLFRHLRP